MPILVVDDEPSFRSAVNTILRKAGFDTIEARDGLEAYEIVRAIGAEVELLLTDFQMPRMDGLSLIESVRELHPKMPVLLMTGARLENRPRSYAVLNKPIGREALLQAVRSAIAAAGMERPTRKVEVFSSGYCCSEKLITAIRAAACPSCEVRVLDVTAAEVAERASQLGVQSVPAVAINDELVCCPCECGPDLAKLRAAGLGVPLS
jgi:DNA-binding NtrC family response regulator